MIVLLILSLVLIGGTIVYGAKGVSSNTFDSKKFKKVLKINIGALLPIVIGFIVLAIPGIANATEMVTTTAATTEAANNSDAWKYMAAALSTGLAALAAGYSVAVAASSAIGAISENEKLMGKTLIYVGLAEGIALYGMIISFMILLVG